MKRTIYSMIMLLAIVFSSCNDWLDVSPKTEMKAEDMFSSESGFRDALVGVYSLMSRADSYGKDLTYGYMDVLAQFYSIPKSETNHTFRYAIAYNYEETSEENRILAIWKNHYTAIANLNMALSFIDVNKSVFADTAVYAVYKGEMLALRGLLHFDLLRMFASSPVMENGSGLSSLAIPYLNVYTNVAQPQRTVQEILALVCKDLLEAKRLMKDKEDFNEWDSSLPMYNRIQRMNYFAATALLARVYLYGGDKANALAQAKEVIGEAGVVEKPTNYQLTQRAAIDTDPMFRSELIFMLDLVKLQDMSEENWNVDSKTTLLSMTTANRNILYSVSEIGSDFRTSWLTSLPGEIYTLAKLSRVNYVPMFKLSELYLIAAECAAGDEGLAYLNELREHRGLKSLAGSENLEENILLEYKREFIGEGQMFFYYKRKGLDKIGVANDVAIADLKAIYNLPIPLSEVDFGNIKK